VTEGVPVSSPFAEKHEPAPLSRAAPTARAPAVPTPGSNVMLRLRGAVSGWVPQAQYQLTRLGPAGVAGAAACAAAAIVGVCVLLSLRNVNEDLNSQILRAQNRPKATVTPEQGLTRIVAQLPTRSEIPIVLGQVLQQAQAAGIELAKGQYTFQPASKGAVGRYELDFPVTAQYPAVRDFINRMMTNIPAAGLHKLTIERKAVGDSQVNADIRFVIFIRDR
jgi:hypothetical protein